SARRGHSEVGLADRLAYAEVARRYPRSAERAREHPLRAPHAEAAHRGHARDHVVIRDRIELCDVEFTACHGARRVDHVPGFAGRELQCADVGDFTLGETIRVEAVDELATDFVTPAIAFGEPPPHCRSPFEIDL